MQKTLFKYSSFRIDGNNKRLIIKDLIYFRPVLLISFLSNVPILLKYTCGFFNNVLFGHVIQVRWIITLDEPAPEDVDFIDNSCLPG
jgi:hypothetical protein